MKIERVGEFQLHIYKAILTNEQLHTYIYIYTQFLHKKVNRSAHVLEIYTQMYFPHFKLLLFHWTQSDRVHLNYSSIFMQIYSPYVRYTVVLKNKYGFFSNLH